ncbi:hypothetical protein TNCV_4769431 [Trichonephila clavipes]|nr:hypothetical protein TNCV_4769391 [Trichonephila clavipes]GFW43591.1 hypothetical protein TNCV_4769431 [Trichonephila clavipes]
MSLTNLLQHNVRNNDRGTTLLIEGVNIDVALFSYTGAFGDGPRHFEPLSSDEDTCAVASPLLTTTPSGGRSISRQI